MAAGFWLAAWRAIKNDQPNRWMPNLPRTDVMSANGAANSVAHVIKVIGMERATSYSEGADRTDIGGR